MTVGLTCQAVHLADRVGFIELNGLVASVVAGAFTTAATMYLAIFVIQIPEINRGLKDTLQRNLFGLDHLDIRQAILSGALDDLPEYATNNPKYPVVLCNPAADEKEAKFDEAHVTNIALGLVLKRKCIGQMIADKFDELRKTYKGRFQHVVLLEAEGSGYSIEGAASREDFYLVLYPTVGEKADLNVARFVAERLESMPAQVFELFNFVTTKVEADESLGTAIAKMVELGRSSALIIGKSGKILGIGLLWKLISVGYGYETKSKVR